jgi:signal peptidase I
MAMTTVKRDGALFLSISAYLLEQGVSVRFHAEGTSMRPAIEDGDVITVGPVEASAIARGDIVLYRYLDRPVAHRVVAIHTTPLGGVVVVLRGDAKSWCDAPVHSDQVIGRVVAIERGAPTIAAKVSRSIARARGVAHAILQVCASKYRAVMAR